MRLLNGVRLRGKFALISLFIVLPVVFANYLLVTQRLKEQAGIAVELQGLAPLDNVLTVLSRLQALHDFNLAQKNLRLSTDGQVSIEPLVQQAQGALQGLAATWPEPTSAARFAQLRDELSSSVQGLAALPYTERQNRIRQAMDRAPELLELVASGTGLSLNRSARVRQSISLLSRYSVKIRELTGQARAVGAQALSLGRLQGVLSGQLDGASVELDGVADELNTLLTRADLPKDLAQSVRDGGQGVRAIKQLVDERILSADTLNTPWQQYFDEVSAQVPVVLGFEQATLAAVRQQLQASQAHARRATLLQAVPMAVMVLLIVYLYIAFYAAMRGSLNGLAQALERLAAGDLRGGYQGGSRDEFGELGTVLSASVQRIRELIAAVHGAVAQVEGQASQVQVGASQSTDAMAAQRRMVEQIASAMEQLGVTAQNVAHSALSTADSAQHASAATAQGRTLVQAQAGGIHHLAAGIEAAMQSIQRLAQSSNTIGQVLEVIKGIAEQTNLLALNAAIEAARAGEQGRGFAVVADEVRGLARRTQLSTGEIEQMISQLQSGVAAAVIAMEVSQGMATGSVAQSVQVQQDLERILSSIAAIAEQSQSISTSAEEQTAVVADIKRHVGQIGEAATRTLSSAHQAQDASQGLGHLVARLNGLIGAFHL
jgi:methyl-accepting chemotaxis protein